MEKLKPEYTFTAELKEKVESILSQLKQGTPEAFEDGQINIDILKDLIGPDATDDEAPEHFGLNWPGKRQARRLAALPPKGTLKPCLGEGVNENTTENIFIEGENLEVLKILRKSYRGRIKMIYIDPPYNTGSDLIYEDDFSEPLEDYLRKSGQKTEEGLLTSNPKSQGRYHSNWLNFMYPRLRIAKDLLKSDGVIFVSIDAHEMHNLMQLMNELFGEENFIANIAVINNVKGRSDERYIATAHEYLLIYHKGEFETLGVTIPEEYLSEYKEEDEKGKYRLQGLRKRGSSAKRTDRPNMYYPFYFDESSLKLSLEPISNSDIIILPKLSDGTDGRWRWGKDTVKENLDCLMAKKVSGRGEYDVFQKDYLYIDDTEKRVKAKSFWLESDFSSDAGTKDYKNLMGNISFDNPKAVEFLKYCISQSCESRDLVLDFFAGSGSFAQAVIEFNKENKTDIRFINIQLPCSSNKNLGTKYQVISEITKERIRRVISREIEAESVSDLPEFIGFKSYTLDRSNIKEWQDIQPNSKNRQGDLFNQLDEQNKQPIHEGTRVEDLITEFMLVEGFPLHSKIKKLDTINKNTIFEITEEEIPYTLYICLDDQIHEGTADSLEITKKDTFICLDRSFDGNDQVKMQLDDICKLKTI